MRLKGRVAVVTGAASGIGKEIARTFVREGAKVAIADLNRIEADAVAAELAGPDRRAIGITMDVTSEEQVEAGMAKVVHTFGPRRRCRKHSQRHPRSPRGGRRRCGSHPNKFHSKDIRQTATNTILLP